jgi:branched-chain amino acid transport system permease protein
MMKWLKTNWFYLVVLIIALVVPLLITNRYYAQVITMSCLFAIGALSMNLILGYTGQMSLAHGGFFAIGAYGVAILTYTMGWNFWLALPVSALLSAFIGFLVGMPALRTRGSYFAITTMCLGEIIYLIAGNWMELTGGHNGIVGIPVPSPISIPGLGKLAFDSQIPQYYLVLFFLLLTLFVMHRLVKSLRGMTFLATAINEDLAEAVGINTFRTKLLSFVVANFFCRSGGRYLCQSDRQHLSVGCLNCHDIQLPDVCASWRHYNTGRADCRGLYHSNSPGISAVPAGLSDDFIRIPADCRDYLLPDRFYGIVYESA